MKKLVHLNFQGIKNNINKFYNLKNKQKNEVKDKNYELVEAFEVLFKK